jgi:DNA-binding NtrC family response regulator
VFPRVSEIVAAAVPHDRLVLWLFQDQMTHVASNDDGPWIESVTVPDFDPKRIDDGFRLVADLARESLGATLADLQQQLLAATAETTDLNEVERQAIEVVMRATRGNKSRAAKRLGLTRSQLYSRLRKYDLDPTAY